MHTLENLRSLRRRNHGHQTTGRRVGRGLPRCANGSPLSSARQWSQPGWGASTGARAPVRGGQRAEGSIRVCVCVFLCRSAGRVGRPWRERVPGCAATLECPKGSHYYSHVVPYKYLYFGTCARTACG